MNYKTSIKIIILALVLALSIGWVEAQWAGPTQAPFGGNTPAPINVGTNLQAKDGSLWADFLGSDTGFFAQGNAEIGGTLTVGGGNPGASKILASVNANGLARWSGMGVSPSCQLVSNTKLGSSASASCFAKSTATGGGGSCSAGYVKSSIPVIGAQDGWQVSCSSGLGSVTASVVCCSFDLIFTLEPIEGDPINPI